MRAWAAPHPDPEEVPAVRTPTEGQRRERALAELVRRYAFDERNVAGALEMLAAQMQVTPDELIDLLAPPT